MDRVNLTPSSTERFN